MNLRLIFSLVVLLGFTACKSSQETVNMDKISKHFYPMLSKTKKLEKDWIIILPGYSGLNVFKDTGHYFRVAEELNAVGFDVIIVEYKKASRKGGQRLKLNFAKRVKWATEHAIEWGKTKGYLDPNTNGHIISWSAGGEGAILLFNDSIALNKHKITSAALYYPSNRDSTKLISSIPILVQTGDLDNVTPLRNVESTYGKKNNVEFIVYSNTRHGFDVESITDEKKLQIPPLFGKRFIFQYNKTATIESREKLIEFLLKN